jgi:hypothetical protein
MDWVGRAPHDDALGAFLIFSAFKLFADEDVTVDAVGDQERINARDRCFVCWSVLNGTNLGGKSGFSFGGVALSEG